MNRPTLKLKKKPAPEPAPVAEKAPPKSSKPVRRSRAEKAAPVLEILAAQYPHLFTPENVKPLRVGIFYELNRQRKAGNLDVTVEPLKVALGYWTSQPEYHKALASGGPRYDIEGNVLGEVTEEEREQAVKKLAKAGHQ